MTDRLQVNIRLDRGLLDQLDELARDERVDRTEMARRLLDDGMAAHRMEAALRAYREGRVSAWRAAELAGVPLYAMLDRIQAAGIPYESDARPGPVPGAATAAREAAAPYATSGTDATTGIDELRERFRPERVETLFVGESSPAGGTHFYRANSNLFRATREAYAAAHGDAVPAGPAFLQYFKAQGAWLVDLADRPVNRLPDAERSAVTGEGVERLEALIAEAKPKSIVVVKAPIGATVRRSAAATGFAGDVTVLPFPVRQWRKVYVDRLAATLSRVS